MEEPKRYDCGNGDGMFDSDKGYWISYEEHKAIVNKLLEDMNYTRSCKSDSEQLPCSYKQVELVRHAAKCKDCGTVFETKW